MIIVELPEPKSARAAYAVVELRHTSWRMAQTSTNYVLAKDSDKYQLCPEEWLRQVPVMSWRMAQTNTNYVLVSGTGQGHPKHSAVPQLHHGLGQWPGQILTVQ